MNSYLIVFFLTGLEYTSEERIEAANVAEAQAKLIIKYPSVKSIQRIL